MEMLGKIEKIAGGKMHAKISVNMGNEIHIIPQKAEDFNALIGAFARSGFGLVSLFCFQPHGKGFRLIYAFEKHGYPEIAVIQRDAGISVPSVAGTFPSACWYEREITDGFGIRFDAAFDRRRLFLHEAYPDDFHPLLKSFKNKGITAKSEISAEEEYAFKKVHGEGVYQVPVGPVHAGIIEPGHFRFSVIGETICNLEIRMFYKHRGIEKLAEDKAPEECVRIAESISGDETAANAAAFCIAAEKIAGIKIPSRAAHLRTVMMEMERIYSHLGDIAGMIIDVAYPAGASPFFIFREEMLRANAELTGSRFMKDAMCIGGVRKNPSNEALSRLSSRLKDFSSGFSGAVKDVLSSPSVVDRLETTGVIRKDLVAALNLSGPIARASGSSRDTRIDHPYGIYSGTAFAKRVLHEGDVLARFKLKAAEIEDSVGIIRELIAGMPEGPICEPAKIPDGSAFSLVESARGQSLHWLSIRNGVVERYKVRTASFCNWQAIEHAVIGNIVPDFPLINKSLNLSYAGTDL